MSQDIGKARTHECGFGPLSCVGAAWLVVAGEIDGELAQDLAGGGVDDAHVVVVGELRSRMLTPTVCPLRQVLAIRLLMQRREGYRALRLIFLSDRWIA
ncbi:hypothetical protein BCE75_103295 [Isoptericola sp. CG 20/1183]|uniref:hypothetical protein n=1 Tax=Isoptericola sp. CG 20/1183 TaxID=1881052 RepID=UPI000D4E681F|nr:MULTISPECIES: hypothetical protein [Isoptericola]PRZ09163.1 hypothetical protein BCE75_103295 [Isoptericola sp. CG 20/1183]